jgi:hypothetical protein
MKALLILTLLVVALAQSASAYTVEANHPRLFVNENTVAGLRAKCASYESTMYDAFKTSIDGDEAQDSYPLGGAYLHGQNLQRLAFAHLVEQDTTGAYNYFALARECADSMFTSWPETWHEAETVQRGMALFYDWCYNDLTAWGRGNYGDSLALACSRYLAGTNFMTDAPHSQMDLLPLQMHMALAIAGDGLDDAGASAALDTVYAHTFGDYHVFACYDSFARDGGSYEGDTYGYIQMLDQTEVCWLWDYGTDHDPWAAAYTNMGGLGDWILYDSSARSAISYTYGFGGGKQSDTETHSNSASTQMKIIYRLETAYSDTVLKWLHHQYDIHTSAAIPDHDKWQGLIAKDTTLVISAAPDSVGFTTAKQFDMGTVFMREAWDMADTSTDVWATYRHEQFPYGHAHCDAGHFIVGRGNDLMLIDSGEYDGASTSHNLNYMTQTIAHNGITIKDFSETFGDKENSGGQTRYTWVGAGMPIITLSDYTDSLAASGDRGKIETYEHVAGTRTYIKSDLTKAYSSAKVDTVRREFVWLEAKDAFLVFDYTALDSTGFLQKSLFHTISAPADTNDVWTVVEDNSKMRIQFFGNASSDTIGGIGDEFEVNGTNYPPSGSHSDNGAWRIEALTPRNSAQRWMLTVIEVVADGTAFATVESLAFGDYIGAAVDGDTVLFHKYGGAYLTGSSGSNPVLDLPVTTLGFTYADSSAQKFGIGNSGDGILSWESTFLSDWIADAANDTGTVGVGHDSVIVQLKWAEIDSAAVWSDTIAVSGGGDGQVVINVRGEIVYIPPTINPALHQKDFFQDLYAISDTVCCHSNHWDIIVPELTYAGDWIIYPFGAKSKLADGINVKATLANSEGGWSETFFIPTNYFTNIYWKNEFGFEQLFSMAVDTVAVQAVFSTCAADSTLQYQFIMEGW